MKSFPKNPFPARSHFDVSGTVGGLPLTSPSGQLMPVKNLSEDIEVELGCSQKSGGASVFFFNLVGTKSWSVMGKKKKERLKKRIIKNDLYPPLSIVF